MKEHISSSYPLYSQDGKGTNAVCVAKFFIGNWTWYILEGSFEGGDFMMYGIIINSLYTEYGYVSLNEMETVNIHGCIIERDLYFKEQSLKNIDDKQLQEWLSSFYSETI